GFRCIGDTICTNSTMETEALLRSNTCILRRQDVTESVGDSITLNLLRFRRSVQGLRSSCGDPDKTGRIVPQRPNSFRKRGALKAKRRTAGRRAFLTDASLLPLSRSPLRRCRGGLFAAVLFGRVRQNEDRAMGGAHHPRHYAAD